MDTTASRRRNVWNEAAAGNRPNASTTPGASPQNQVRFSFQSIQVLPEKQNLDISS